jgi:poly-beta-1,6-N-acetyl-D-glucosamine synthase
MIPILLFWASLSAIVYMFVGYPLALAVWSAVRPRRWQQQPCEPTVSIVISAYNEAASMAAKIQSLLSLDYPAERVEILVGSDGSTDGTSEQLLAISDERVQAFVFPQRRGKPAVLNTLVPKARGEIIFLSDVRQKFDSRVLRLLVQSFSDPQVGAVSAEVILTRREDGTAVSEGSGFYWRYETFIRSRESLIDSSIAVTGPIYAIRKMLFEPIPDDTIVDDVLIPLRIARRGYRVVIEPEARAYDAPYAVAGQEFTRKVRTLAGNFQLFARERWLFNPLRNRLWWQTMSHKALRLLIAPLQIALIAANIALFGSFFYKIAMLAQILFYAGAIAGWLLPREWKKPFVITFPYFFCLLSWASVLAFLRSITGRQPVTWQKATASETQS